MMRRLASLWLVLLAVLAGVAMCGSLKVGYGGGYDQGYGARSMVGYSGGGGHGRSLALIVVADDGYKCNLAWSAAADSIGFTYTLAPSDAPVGGIGDTGFLTTEELATVASRGIDVGSTGTHHRTNSIKAHVYTAGQDAAYNDSLNVSTTPAWVTAITGVAPRSWSTDGYQWTYRAAKNARAQGYRAVAAGFGYDANASDPTTSGHEYLRGVIESGTAGWDRFDPARFLPLDAPGCLYGIGTFPGETNTGSIFGASAAGSTDKATLFANLDAAADTVRAHGNAPIIFRLHGYTVTREDLENVYLWCRSNNVWMTNLKEFQAWYRRSHIPVDPPHWAWQAKLDGITAADSIFWGPAPAAAASCTADSFIFSRYTTAVTRANYTGQVNEGHGYGWLDYDTQGNSGSWSAKVFRPQAGGFASGHPAITMGFDVSSLNGRQVVSADLYYYTEYALDNTSLPPAEMNYTAVMGITNPAMLQYANNKQSSYDYGDSAQTIARAVELVNYDRYYKISNYIYPNEGYTKFQAGWGRQRVTEYVQRVLDNGMPSAGFMFWGKKASSNAYCNVDMPNATASKRPYLVVRTCPIGDAPQIEASAGNGIVSLSWSAAASQNNNRVNVYRYYDGSQDTTKIASLLSWPVFTDVNAVNGTPHNYFATLVSPTGAESQDGNHIRATPRYVLSIQEPAYASLWYENVPNGNYLTFAQYNKLAKFDALVTWSYPFKSGAANEVAYDQLLAALRLRNPDQILLTYIMATTPSLDWATYPAGSPERRAWNYMAGLTYAGVDSAGFARNLADHVAVSDVYPTNIVNVCYPDLADTLARYWVEALDASDSDGYYAGFFVDLADSTLANHLCYSDGCQSKVDFDGDNTAYASDANEKTAFKQFHIDFLRAIRREFAQRAMPNRLIVANTTFGRSLAPTSYDHDFLEVCDGVLFERFTEFWPGPDATASEWSKVATVTGLLTNAQVSPPLVLWHAAADSSNQNMTEVPALAYGGFACVQDSTDGNGENAIATMEARLPSLGARISTAFAGDDTLTAEHENGFAKLLVRPAYSSDTAVMPYSVTAGTDTLSLSRYWERAGEEGAPTEPLYHTRLGDRKITINPYFFGAASFQWVPSDFSHWEVVMEWEDEPMGSDTTLVYLDDMQVEYFDGENDWYGYEFNGLDDGMEYCFRVRAVDVLGNKSVSKYLGDQCRTPVDLVPPPEGLTNVIASGGQGYVSLDWEYPAPPEDFDHFSVNRRLAGVGEYAEIGTPVVSAYNDSTAISGVYYNYVVKVVDDAGLEAYIGDSQVTGAWFGTVEPTYPAPSNVRALADNPSGSTAVVVYPPTDTTGLTGYSIYRGRKASLAAVDTAACTLYKTGLTPGDFNGCVFYDSHATNGAAPDTAFQYTARALYSGHASAKYAVPAWALSTGGISQQTPTCLAYGNGSAISVAVSPVAGCDSTRIFRGTTSGTQTLITTVLATNNPYTDTTAAANTDYYYRVRQVASGGTIVTLSSAVSGPVRWVSVPAGTPAISGVTGTIASGQSVVISGNNFGSKTVAAPYRWNDYETWPDNQAMNINEGNVTDPWTTGGWHSQNPNNPPRAKLPSSSTAPGLARGVQTHSLFQDYRNDKYNCEMYLSNIPSSKFYFSGWYRCQEYGEDSNNVKMFEICDNYYNSSSWQLRYGSNFDGTYRLDTYVDDCGPAGVFLGDRYNYGSPDTNTWMPDGQWHRIEMWFDAGTQNGNDGLFVTWKDTSQWKTISGSFKESSDCSTDWFHLMFYSCTDGRSPTAEREVWWDETYFDVTRARVEIGDNETYSLCTHREIQIPSAWSSNGTSITATLNTGSFSNGTAYLFVVDSDGNTSAGYPITIANP